MRDDGRVQSDDSDEDVGWMDNDGMRAQIVHVINRTDSLCGGDSSGASSSGVETSSADGPSAKAVNTGSGKRVRVEESRNRITTTDGATLLGTSTVQAQAATTPPKRHACRYILTCVL